MAKRPVENTALGAAVCRLIEQYQPPATRLFDDPIVKDLVSSAIRVLMGWGWMRNFTVRRTNAVAPGLFGSQICRTRYIDDALRAAVRDGNRQVVILGAGLDTRAYRLPALKDVPVFELDLPTVQAEKQGRLRQALGRLPDNVTFVPIDFTQQRLPDALAASRLDPTRPAVFVWEAVTQYLPAAAVQQTLEFIGAAAPGSLLVFTYVLQSVIEHRSNVPGADKMLESMAKNGAPFIFGLEPAGLAAYLEPFHLRLMDDAGNAEYQARYLKPMGRSLEVTEAERAAVAVAVAAVTHTTV